MFKQFSLLLISGYQKYISPYKGFSCAYRVHANGLSCSAYGKRVISKHGVFMGLLLLNRRFYDCKWHYEQHAKSQSSFKYRGLGGKYSRQRGFVDADCSGCDGLDAGSCDGCHDCNLHDHCTAGELCNDLDCGLDALNCATPDSGCKNVNCCGSGSSSSSFKEKRSKKNQMKYGGQIVEPAEQENSEQKPIQGVDLQKKDI